jgi:hypothetical protein
MKHCSGSYQRRQQYETLLWFIPEKTTIWNITLVLIREDNNMKHCSGSLIWTRGVFHIVVFSGMNQSNVSYCCLLCYEPE